ncbi:MAG TPA: cell wall hydrolase [Mesorhizobium sp.]|uniref:cell wall hydrolase n=1 Tax=Mesorhizobium sp. TaxID=1871066 RepID=UPI002DDDB577|nr:cell wall hydrolase [Mesorhizobium sp.]HEV2504843.1 cell wall hydrolase [Mesorhizobium sp.]
MIATRWKKLIALGTVVLGPLFLAACSQTTGSHGLSVAKLSDSVAPSSKVGAYRYTSRDKECLARAMFFESNRSSRDGMVAVGTVVMNRLRSGKYGDNICSVVGQPGQFAPGVMTRRMNSKALPDVMDAAESVLKGERSTKAKNSMFFHTAGLKFPYKNMHYVLVAGGNAFYEKRGRNWQPLPEEGATMMAAATPVAPAQTVAVASAATVPTTAFASTKPAAVQAAAPVMVASAEPTQLPFMTASAVPSERPQPVLASATAAAEPQPVMSFQSTPENTDAIGALIVSESRPLQ